MSLALAVLFIGTLIFLAYAFSWIFHRTNIPDVLPLFLIGILIGPVLGFVRPEFFGQMGPIFAALVLILILFTEGIEMSTNAVLGSLGRATILVIAMNVTTAAFVAPLAHGIFGVSYLSAIIAGLILGSTSAAVVLPLARGLLVSEPTITLLGIEASLNEILTVVVVFSLLQLLQTHTFSAGAIVRQLVILLAFSLAAGIAVGLLWARIVAWLRSIRHGYFISLAFVLVVFGIGELIGGNGYLTVLVFAIAVGNAGRLRNLRFFRLSESAGNPSFAPLEVFTESEKDFYAGVTFIFKAFMFVYIGISLDLSNLWYLVWGAGVMAVLFVFRFLMVKWTLAGTVPPRDLLYAEGIAARGVAGAAILTIIGDPVLENLSYPIIFFSILLTSVYVFLVRSRASSLEIPVAAPLPEPPVEQDTRSQSLGGGGRAMLGI